MEKNSKKNERGALFSSFFSLPRAGVRMLQEYDATVMRARVRGCDFLSLSLSDSLSLSREEMDWMRCGFLFLSLRKAATLSD